MELQVKKTENYAQIHTKFKISRMDTTGNLAEPSTPSQSGKIGKSSVSTNIHAHKDEHIEASPIDDNI